MTLRAFLALPCLALVTGDTRAETDFALKGQWLSNDVNGPAGPSRIFLEFLPGQLVAMRVEYLAPQGEIAVKGTYTVEGKLLRTEILNAGEPVELIVLDPNTIRFGRSAYLRDLTFTRQPIEAKAP